MTEIRPVPTERLELVPSTPTIAQAASEDRVALGEILNCAISDRWPPQIIHEALEEVADQVCDQPETGPWSIWYAIDRTEHMLVGNVRFQGPPEGGEVELLYAMADDMYGKGFATEAVGALSDWALAQSGVHKLVAMVEPGLDGAVRVLEKSGFAEAGTGPEGRLRYERSAL